MLGRVVEDRDRPLPSAYWVEPGPLLAGAHPGGALDALLDAGVTHVFDLTEQGEYGLPPYVADLEALAAARGRTVRYANVPIRDLGCPSSQELERLLDELDAVVGGGGL